MAINDKSTKKVVKALPFYWAVIALIPLSALAYQVGFANLSEKVNQPYYDIGSVRIDPGFVPEIPKRELLEVTNFGIGTCVPYARNRTGVLIFGNADTFLNQAYSAGYRIAQEPIEGSIVVFEDYPYGHVAAVESVSENEITISEQNWLGAYIVSQRTVSTTDKTIKGYIY